MKSSMAKTTSINGKAEESKRAAPTPVKSRPTLNSRLGSSSTQSSLKSSSSAKKLYDENK